VNLTLELVPGQGTIYAYTILYHTGDKRFASAVPYASIIVELDAAPGALLVGNLLEAPSGLGVLAALADALAVEGWPDTARDSLRPVSAYLERPREHMHSAQYKELGLPRGSGMVEGACKWLIQQRCKGVGRRWSEDGFNPLVHLRLVWVNGRVEALFGLTLSPNE